MVMESVACLLMDADTFLVEQARHDPVERCLMPPHHVQSYVGRLALCQSCSRMVRLPGADACTLPTPSVRVQGFI